MSWNLIERNVCGTAHVGCIMLTQIDISGMCRSHVYSATNISKKSRTSNKWVRPFQPHQIPPGQPVWPVPYVTMCLTLDLHQVPSGWSGCSGWLAWRQLIRSISELVRRVRLVWVTSQCCLIWLAASLFSLLFSIKNSTEYNCFVTKYTVHLREQQDVTMKSPLETGSPKEHEGTDDSGEASIKKSAENRESESAAISGWWRRSTKADNK